jgi:hypothetical protein
MGLGLGLMLGLGLWLGFRVASQLPLLCACVVALSSINV